MTAFPAEAISDEIHRGISEESLSIEVTTHCNKMCSHCFARAGISEPSSLSIGLVKQIITEGRAAGYRRLHITGGEPLLWPGLLDVLDYTFALGYMGVFLNSNGTLLTQKVCKELKKHENLALSISLHGTKKIHDGMCGRGSYLKTTNGIQNAHEAGLRTLIFSSVGRSLIPQLPHFAHSLYKRFPDITFLCLIQMIRVADDVHDVSQELLEPHDFINLVQIVSLLNMCGLKTDVLNNPLARVTSSIKWFPWPIRSRPLYSPGDLIIMSNRDISLAHSSRVTFGKYKSAMIEKVLTSESYEQAVSADTKTCVLCKHVELCRENGMTRPSEWFRDLHPEVPYCKRVLDMALQ